MFGRISAVMDSAKFSSFSINYDRPFQQTVDLLRWITRVFAVAVLLGCGSAPAQTPEIVIHSASKPPGSVVLSLRPNTTSGWLLLESSDDLDVWNPVVNLLTTNTTGPYMEVAPSNALFRFYRVRSPGVAAAEALGRWNSTKPEPYRFRFQTTKWELGGSTLIGTVTFSNGVKTVSSVTLNEIPADSFDPADFPTIEEVFDRIAAVEALGAKLAHVTYDPDWSFPSSVAIVGDTTSPVIVFQLSDFTKTVP
jgi:hypothetical protein